jgi:hypothetical protein
MNRNTLIEQVLRVSGRVTAKKARGSSTIVYSKKGETYCLTNHHVIESNIEYKDVWDDLIKRDRKKDFTAPVEIDFGRITDDGLYMASTTVLADIVCHCKEQDIALLKLRDNIDYPAAQMPPEDKCQTIPLVSELCCCGAALGEKPIVTFGHLNAVQIEIDNYEYWMSSAPSIFGNSGGGIFLKRENGKSESWYFIGIPSRISVVPLGFGANAITHMGYFIPIPRIYKWLEDMCYQFIFNPEYTPEKCEELRKARQAQELSLFVHQKAQSGE